MEVIKILLQTTIPTTGDDWSIARFRTLAEFLRSQRDGEGVRVQGTSVLGSPARGQAGAEGGFRKVAGSTVARRHTARCGATSPFLSRRQCS